MIEWSGELDITLEDCFDEIAPFEQCVLFDIETTGFSAQNTFCYLIGYCYYENQTWKYRMLFNDDSRSELSIIQEFSDVLSHYNYVVHYNGDGFDIPYLIEKYHQYRSFGFEFAHPLDFASVQSIDLYKIIKKYKKGLPLPNLKLPTVEAALGIIRKDAYTGGELVHVYKKYADTRSDELEQLLFRHNYEDITAMIPMLRIFSFLMFEKNHYTIQNIDLFEKTESNDCMQYIKISLLLEYHLPFFYQTVCNNITLTISDSVGVLTIPVFEAELKYYIHNWKDYYYLPLENKVIHKSIGAYVDSTYKEKATKSNCYLTKTAMYLPLPWNYKQIPSDWKNTSQLKVYRYDIQDKICYIEYSDALLNNEALFTGFIRYMF